MTFKQLANKLARNATAFARNGETDKAAACLAVVDLINTNGYTALKGEVTIDNLVETV